MGDNSEMETEDMREESKKRPLDDSAEGGISKKSNFGEDGQYHLKIMVPGAGCGAIIGKGGETIAKMQKSSGARVKMAKNADFYPGTHERVCIISGPLRSVVELEKFFIDKILEKLDPHRLIDPYDYKNTERGKELKLLVTNTTAGMIIGKGGSYIKEIKEKTGAYAQVSMKSSDPRLLERVVTVIGAPEQLVAATELILAKMATDPTANQFNNTSYADVSTTLLNGVIGGVDGGMEATVSQPQQQQLKADERNNNTIVLSHKSMGGAQPTAGFPNNFYSSQVFQPANSQQIFTADPSLMRNVGNGGSYSPRLTGPPQFIGQMGDPMPMANGVATNAGILQFLENLQMSLRGAGYNDLALTEIMTAMQTLAKYNVLGLAFGFGLSTLTPPGVVTHQTYTGSMGGFIPSNTNLVAAGGYKFGPAGHKQNGLAPEFIPSANQMPMMTQSGDKSFQQGWKQPEYIDYTGMNQSSGKEMDVDVPGDRVVFANGFVASRNHLEMSPMVEEKEELKVHENIIGAILGKQGRSLMDIQNNSGAKVEVSKKGIFCPGTQNRLVTISGTKEAIRIAKFMIEKRIIEEQSRRETRHGAKH